MKIKQFFEVTSAVFCLALFVPVSLSLYEDQIGVFDWTQKFLGNIRFVEQDLLPFSGTYVFGSGRNVIATVFSENGSLAWRHVLEDGGTLDNLILCERTIVSFSSVPYSVVRAWSALSGSVIWEKSFEWLENSKCQCGPVSSTLLCSSANNLLLFSLFTGKVLWSDDKLVQSSVCSVDFISPYHNANDTHKLVTILGPNLSANGLKTLTLVLPTDDLKRISVVDSVSVRSPESWPTGRNDCLTLHAAADTAQLSLVCVSSHTGDLGGIVYSLPLTGRHSDWLSFNLSEKSPQIHPLTGSHFAVTSSGSGAVYEINSSGRPTEKFPLQQAMFVALSSSGDRDYLFVGYHDIHQVVDNFLLTVYDMHSEKPVEEASSQHLSVAKHHGTVQSMHASVFRKPDGSLGFRLLLKTEDHAILLFRETGHLQWVREEALADIAAVELVDLPVSESQARMEEEFGHTHRNLLEMFFRRLRTQAAQLVAFSKSCLTKMGRILDELMLSLSSKTYFFNAVRQSTVYDEPSVDAISQSTFTIPPHFKYSDQQMSSTSEVKCSLTRDTFNLHKMIVIATAVGKVFGLESEKGRVVWKYLVADANLLANGKLALFQQRSTSHFPLPPIATLVLRSKLTNLPMLFSFNPITGAPVERSMNGVYHFPTDIIQAVLLPGPIRADTDYTRPILLLDGNAQVHSYPSEYSQSWNPEVLPLYLYTIEPTSGRLTGYLVQTSMTSPRREPRSASRVWQMYLQSPLSNDSHPIVAFASRPSTEHIHSVGRVLGDRSVLYKYLNPNLIAVLTAGGNITMQTNLVMLYLVDVVTGRIVYSSVHRRCSEPVNLVFSENWIVYTYYNHKSLRHEATVLELFEPTADGEPCAAYSIPGPIQLLLQNILPTSWLSNLFGFSKSDPELQMAPDAKHQSLGPRALYRGSRAIFSSLYRTTGLDGFCPTTGTSSLIPRVLQQSYIFSTSPVHGAAAVSLTERGITSKSIIFGLQKGSIIELPKALFDPRRVIELTPELAEEGVHPYAPVLPLSDQSVISFNQSIMGIRAIRTATTGLESTSVVLAYGLDLFFTRIAPSLTYDLLKEDFDYTAIATVTLGMVLASVITQRLAARRAMFRAWN